MINEKVMEEIKKMLKTREMTARQILEEIDLQLSPQKLAHILIDTDDIDTIEHTCYWGSSRRPNTYRVYDKIVFTGNIVKEKNILKLEIEGNDFITYDFNTNRFTSQKVPSQKAQGINDNVVLQIFSDSNYRRLMSCEWLYSYLDLLDTNIHNLIGIERYKCPSGFINWLRKEGLKINLKNIMTFDLTKQYTHLPIPFILSLIDNNSYWSPNNNRMLKVFDSLWEINFDKIINNSIKKCEFNIARDMNDLANTIIDYTSNNMSWKDIIDTNRTITYNTENLQNLYEERKNANLSANLQKLNFLNDMVVPNYEKYTIVVPQTIKDLINEGKMQNNCVGHYYNDSINEGRNLIYFIRYTDNKDKSLVTCRYSTSEKSTVEHRTKNNYATSYEQNKVIEIIDKIIKENLKK